MDKIRPFLFDTVIGLIFILLPGIRGYSDWQIHEYGLIPRLLHLKNQYSGPPISLNRARDRRAG